MASADALVDSLSEDDVARAVTAYATQAYRADAAWFDDSVVLDAETNARWTGHRDAAVAAAGGAFTHADAIAAARVDPDVFVAYTRYRNLLDPPSRFWQDPGMADKVRAAIAAGAPHAESASPTRAQLLRLA